jgi:hypothetical protein
MSRDQSDDLDEACMKMLGHTNWKYRDTILVKEMVKYKRDDAIHCSVLFFKEPLKEEDE